MAEFIPVTEESLRAAMRDPRYWRSGHPEREDYNRGSPKGGGPLSTKARARAAWCKSAPTPARGMARPSRLGHIPGLIRRAVMTTKLRPRERQRTRAEMRMPFSWRRRRPLCRARSAWLRKSGVCCHGASRHSVGLTCLMRQSTKPGAEALLLGHGTTRSRNSLASERLPAKPMQKRQLRRSRKQRRRHRKVPNLIGRATRFILGSRVSISRDTTIISQNAGGAIWRRT